MIDPYWEQVSDGDLRQGDWLPRCPVPTLAIPPTGVNGTVDTRTEDYDVCVVTQSCDLANKKVRLVAYVPIFSLAEFEISNPYLAKKGRWNDVLKGRADGLHLLASPTTPDDNRQALVVDFR